VCPWELLRRRSVISKIFRSSVLPFVLALLTTAASHAGPIRIGDTRARKLAKDPHIPGKFVDGQCLPFALALRKKFEAAGIRSKILIFQYTTLAALPDFLATANALPAAADYGGRSGSHAVVIYDDEGRTYAMDNQSWQPTWLHDDSAEQLAGRLGGMRTLVESAYFVKPAVAKPTYHGASAANSQSTEDVWRKTRQHSARNLRAQNT